MFRDLGEKSKTIKKISCKIIAKSNEINENNNIAKEVNISGLNTVLIAVILTF